MQNYLKTLANLVLGICFCLVLGVATAQAATLTVTKLADTNDGRCDTDCSLREAIAQAGAGDTIDFASPLFDTPQVITLSDAPGFRALTINQSITIAGRGANKLTIARDSNASAQFSVFSISGNFVVNLSGMTITGGNDEGGGIRNVGAQLTITGSVITGNISNLSAGGIRSEGTGSTLTIDTSTISDNVANGTGPGVGGIYVENSFTMTTSTVSGNVKNNGTGNAGGIWTFGTSTVTSCTITNNQAAGQPTGASGFYVNGSQTATIRNTIIAGNQNDNTVPDINTTGQKFVSGGFNFIGDEAAGAGFTAGVNTDIVGTISNPLDPKLAPLGDYGGTTPTHRPQLSSSVIDKGNSFGIASDQIGNIRGVDIPTFSNAPGGDASDIGSFEFTNTLTVTKIEDTNDGVCDSDCSLREAIAVATPGTNIIFASPLFDTPQVITLSGASGFQSLTINENLTISGKGATQLTIKRDSSDSAHYRIFNLAAGASEVSLKGLTVSGGFNTSPTTGGGGILNEGGILEIDGCVITGNTDSELAGGIFGGAGSKLIITNSTISDNSVGGQNIGSGGISTSGMLTMTNTTVSGNVTNGNQSGGGIFASERVTIESCTITDNQAASGAGGWFGAGTVSNTIIAGNRNNTTIPDVAGSGGGTVKSFNSLGYNLIGNPGPVTDFTGRGDLVGKTSNVLNPGLAPLALAGGQTPTHAILPGSPALDAGNSFGLGTDQRGNGRPFDNPAATPGVGGDNSDIGAYEAGAFAPLVVTKTADTNDGVCDSDCSLREAIAAAGATGNQIVFASPLFDTPQTITLSDAPGFQSLAINNKGLTIEGRGAKLLTIMRSPGATTNFRIFDIFGPDPTLSATGIRDTVSISGMTITGGQVRSGTDGPTDGGGIFNSANILTLSGCRLTLNSALTGGGGIENTTGGALTLVNSTVDDNFTVAVRQGGSGAGIDSDSTLVTITNSTISSNFLGSQQSGSGGSGGIWTAGGTITNSTITNNGLNGSGSGGLVSTSTTTLRGSIVAANQPNLGFPDVTGTVISGGYNLIGNRGTDSFTAQGDQSGTSSNVLNPLLSNLGDYGGQTPTHCLMNGSPAIDGGNSFGFTTDQRGFVRPIDISVIQNATGGDGSDIGAYELQSLIGIVSVSITSGQNPSLVGQSVHFTATVSPQASWTVPTGTIQFKDGGQPIGALQMLSNSNPATATLDFTFTSAGSHSITADYSSGDMNFGNNTGTLTGNPQVVLGQPTIAKAFGFSPTLVNHSTPLSFTINNPNTIGATGLSFTDAMPSGMVVASTPGIVNQCGGTFNAIAGSGTISFSGGTLAASSSCSITLNIIANAPGDYNNTTGALSSNETGAGGPSNTATITALVPAVFTKAFGSSTITQNGTTSLTFTITNPSGNTRSLMGLGFGDPFPAGLIVATPNGFTGTCGGATITATPGSSSVSMFGGTLPVQSSCTFSVNVTATGTGTINNVTGIIASTNGGAGSPATATLNVVAPTLSIHDAALVKPASGTATMLFTVSLPSPAVSTTTVHYSTADGSAVAGTDYVAAPDTVLTFNPGEQVLNIPITIDGGTATSKKSFSVTLIHASPATIGTATATGTILPSHVASSALISQFRTSGPAGAGDGFVEVYNNSAAALRVHASDGGSGWALVSSGPNCGQPELVGLIPENTMIPAWGHFLLTGSKYSLQTYPAGVAPGTATADQPLLIDLDSDTNIGLFSASSLANISSANRLDAAGFQVGGNCSLLEEGTPLLPALNSQSQYAYIRNLVTGISQDTDNNFADFMVVSTTPNTPVGNNNTPVLGAPGPSNLSSPVQSNGLLVPGLVDPDMSSTAAQNRVRSTGDYVDTPALSGTGDYPMGTLTIRRTYMNQTGIPVTRLRFRIVDITGNPAPAGVADLRAITSSDITLTNDRGQTVPVVGTILESPEMQPMGGGINSTLTVTLGQPLQNGSTVAVQFLLGVKQGGSFRFFLNIEALQ